MKQKNHTSFIKYQRDATYSVYLVYFLQLYMFRTRTASETCRVVKKTNKQNKLHLVGIL